MEGFGFQENVEIEGRTFKIHTGYHPDRNIAISEVFEYGNFLFQAHEKFYVRKSDKKPLDESYLKNVTKKIHLDTIDEIVVLFQVNEKLKLIRQPIPHFRLGKVFYVRNFLDEAIDNFKRAIQLKPDFIKAHKLLGLAYLKQKNYQNALKVLESILDIGNNFPDILNILGVTYIHFGKYERAREVIHKALDLKPDFLHANFNMGLLLFLSALNDNQGEHGIVIPSRIIRFLKIIRNHDQYQSAAWTDIFDRTDEILKTGDRKKIIEMLTDLQLRLTVHDDFNVIMDFFFLKFMYGGKELSRSEMDYYERLILEEGKKDQDKYADYWNELGVIHLIQCRDYFLKAMSEFENAIKINPTYTAAKNSLDITRHGKRGFLILLRAILK
ncbi:MAG: tetratricopeptide repeat protein [Calditrichaceae bacterium]|nr:tetratricopeptide repeat protein [Calditrichaceae bacterium]MBN2709934.1 tetratricopeptide repeat protein [Calditrichaceae bacterium]